MEKNFSPAWLFQFQQLIEVGSFTETALKLKLSQQALSKNVQALETWAGQALIHRRPGNLELTPAGALLNEAIPELLQSLQKVKHRVHTPISTVHVGVTPFWDTCFLPETLVDVLQAWPELDLQVAPLWEQDIMAFLLAGELDLGLVLRTPGKGVEAEALPPIRWALAASPQLQRGPDDSFPYLLASYNQTPPELLDESLLPQPAHCLGRCDSWQLMRSLLLDGVAAAFVPWPRIRAELAAGSLIEIETAPLPVITPYAVWLEGIDLHPASRFLLERLRREMLA